MAEQMMIFGRHPVAEFLTLGQDAKALVVQDSVEKSLHDMVSAAKSAGLQIERCSKKKLDQLSQGANHQGVLLKLGEFRYTDFSDLLQQAKKQQSLPCLVALDEIQDPQNLGSMMRSAAAFGVHGMILPDRRAAHVTPTVFKTSAGAAGRVPVARVKNFRQALETAKEEGFWVVGTVVEGGVGLCEVDFCRPTLLVIGSENKGLRDLSAKTCDSLATIDLASGMESLNAAVAGALCFYELRRQRAALP
jgi:23S rRNA (guanosine2251-2'-O)-methyltransferase